MSMEMEYGIGHKPRGLHAVVTTSPGCNHRAGSTAPDLPLPNNTQTTFPASHSDPYVNPRELHTSSPFNTSDESPCTLLWVMKLLNTTLVYLSIFLAMF
jgi:hypothetical protein